MKGWQVRRRLVGGAMVLALLATTMIGGASGLAMTDQQILKNGNFEGGFTSQPGCGLVGTGWGCFTNGGTIAYGFYDDQWQPVVSDGAHSQLIELNTMQYAASESDRYAGIYQTVDLVKGATYSLSMRGLMRERDPDPTQDKFRYRVQWGYTVDGSTDWAKVGNWQELPWDKIDERTAPTGLQSFATTFAAPSTKVTLFVRVWKKWGTAYKELDVNLDAISLVGKKVVQSTTSTGSTGTAGSTGSTGTSGAGTAAPAACGGTSLVANGNFEGGFVNGVGKGWTSFANGGRSAYGFYDEMWAPVVKDGQHGQLIEINTWGLAAADSDRVAGIWQVVGGLNKGTTYELSLYALMREEAAHPDEDAFRYRLQWGYAVADANPSAADITNWMELPLDRIDVRTAPGAMTLVSGKFQAPAAKIVLAVRAWKKWATVQRELDVNLDAIKVVPCTGGAATGTCVYVVARGDYLGAIAKRYGTTISTLVNLNGLRNPNILIVGQKLKLPCKAGGVVVPPTQIPPKDTNSCTWVTVKRGDTVGALAARYRSTIALIAERNKLANPNLIYPGQRLCIVPR